MSVEDGAGRPQADLARAEHACGGPAVDVVEHGRGVVVGLTEEVHAPGGTGEHQGGLAGGIRQRGAEVVVGRGAVSHLELHSGPHRDVVPTATAPVAVQRRHAADQEVHPDRRTPFARRARARPGAAP